LPIVPVEPGGWNNRTFRLGSALSVRLPRARRYASQASKEHRWLPKLAASLPLPIPESLALGRPGFGYPWRWSVRRWIDGDVASRQTIIDLNAFAHDLAAFLNALRRIDAQRGPAAGRHNFFRGDDLRVYDAQTWQALSEAGEDAGVAADIWKHACATHWDAAPVWVHGDIAAGNLLLRDGRLAAIIDFGNCGTGDPACDLVIAWTLLDAPARRVFRQALTLDEATWARAKGWALWKALITLRGGPAGQIETARLALQNLLADHSGGGD
jgi:aminoglycoside phosphotransferase (APT) family kinase protein